MKRPALSRMTKRQRLAACDLIASLEIPAVITANEAALLLAERSLPIPAGWAGDLSSPIRRVDLAVHMALEGAAR